MKINAYGLTDIGRKRMHNEDCFLINDDLGLYMIADGMGGHSGGEYASRLAVDTVEEVVKQLLADPEATVISGVNTEEADFSDRLRYAIQVASKKIYDRAFYDTSLKGMGTTSVVAMFHEGKVYIANVGDSRAYLFHANKMRQITSDHSLVNEQLKAGLISKQDIKGHKLKNIITRSVGYQESVEIDLKKYDLHMGDKIFLCSDGLSNMVEDEEIEKVITHYSVREACKKLIDLANEKGGDDNITVLLMSIAELN